MTNSLQLLINDLLWLSYSIHNLIDNSLKCQVKCTFHKNLHIVYIRTANSFLYALFPIPLISNVTFHTSFKHSDYKLILDILLSVLGVKVSRQNYSHWNIQTVNSFLMHYFYNVTLYTLKQTVLTDVPHNLPQHQVPHNSFWCQLIF